MTQGATRLLEQEQTPAGADAPAARVAEPEMPHIPAVEPGPRAGWDERARRFYRFGPDPAGKAEPALQPALDWASAAPAALLPLRDARPGMPAVLIPGQAKEPTSVQALDLVIERALETVRGAGHPARVLADILPRLIRRISRAVRAERLPTPLRDAAGREMERLVSDLDLSGESGESLVEDGRRLIDGIADSWLVFGPSASSELITIECLRRAREPARSKVAGDVRALAEHVNDLLRIDNAKGSSEGLREDVRDGLGSIGARIIDHEALAGLHPDRKAKRLGDDRRKRLQKAADVIDAWLSDTDGAPLPLHLVSPDGAAELQDALPAGVEPRSDERPLRAATETFLEVAGPIVELARAIRVARLETTGAYRPEVHDDAIETLDWQALKPEELALVPPVLAVADLDRILGREIGDLCGLVWSGRPVLVLARGATPGEDELGDLSRHQPSLGTLAVAMHHAWVLQSSSARPAHLARGLLEADTRRPSLALVSTADTAVAGEAAVSGRAWPLFVFRPEDRELILEGNPQHERDWPTFSTRIRKEKSIEELDVVITFAEAAAASPAGQRHLLPVPADGWDDEQVPLHEWIAHPKRDLPGGPVPFIWLVAGDGALWRAVVSRALAMATADRLGDFRMLQEMAGVGGVHLARARKEARDQALAEAEAEREQILKERDEAVEAVARDAAREAMSGLAAALLDQGSLAAALGGPAMAPRPRPEEAAESVQEPEPEPEPEPEEEEPLLLDPWIDTPLCTSCNDCFKINELLFRYDENKQAVFADLSKGTYAHLVRAAEICPAKCIHPGKPKPDDPTATPEMVARGAKL